MIDRRHMYDDFIKSTHTKITKATDKLHKYEKSKEYILRVLDKHRDAFTDLGINFEALILHPFTAYAKISDLAKNGQLSKVSHYIKAYGRVCGYINFYTLAIERLNNCIMPYKAYVRLLDISNDNIARTILQGDIYTFNGSIGKLYIKEVPRTFTFKGTPITQPVDWGKTNAYKKELLAQGVTLYNAENAPNGKKWFVRHTNEINYWFWWEGGPIANRSLFRFYPSKFCNFSHKFYLRFLANCKNIDDILECHLLGNLNKMHILLNFDNTHYINYKE